MMSLRLKPLGDVCRWELFIGFSLFRFSVEWGKPYGDFNYSQLVIVTQVILTQLVTDHCRDLAILATGDINSLPSCSGDYAFWSSVPLGSELGFGEKKVLNSWT